MNPQNISVLATDWLNPHMQYSTRDIQSKLASNIVDNNLYGGVTRTGVTTTFSFSK